jgi:4'-phosphopantetheinyl transferase
MTASLWAIPPPNLKLEPDEVHIWRASLNVGTSRVESLLTILCAEEQQKARRFRFSKDQNILLLLAVC